MLGRVLRSNTTTFTFGRTLNAGELPAFGDLVRSDAGADTVYALIFDIMVEDDPFVRQIVAASAEMSAEKIEDMRQRRQVPVEITALAVGFSARGRIMPGVPPRPPAALQGVVACSAAETREVLDDFGFFRLILAHGSAPTDELLIASLRTGVRCQDPARQRAWLLRAGRELVHLLGQEPARLDAILRRLAALPEVARV